MERLLIYLRELRGDRKNTLNFNERDQSTFCLSKRKKNTGQQADKINKRTAAKNTNKKNQTNTVGLLLRLRFLQSEHGSKHENERGGERAGTVEALVIGLRLHLPLALEVRFTPLDHSRAIGPLFAHDDALVALLVFQLVVLTGGVNAI